MAWLQLRVVILKYIILSGSAFVVYMSPRRKEKGWYKTRISGDVFFVARWPFTVFKFLYCSLALPYLTGSLVMIT